MKTVIVPAPGKIEIRQVETPVINAYQALVKTEMVALCNATDSKLVAGKFPGVDTYPLALGHENAGIVVAVGEKVCNFKVGDRVIGGLISDFGAQGINSGWGGFSEYVVVNDFEVLKEEGLATPEQGCWDSFEIQNAVPSHVQPEEAVISCTWREVLGAFKDFNLTPGNAAEPWLGYPENDPNRWKEAADICRTIINTNQFILEKDRTRLSRTTINGEVLWMKKGQDGNALYADNWGYKNSPMSFKDMGTWAGNGRPCRGQTSPTQELVDAFPMKNGKSIDEAKESGEYNPQDPYKNRDPRLTQTVFYHNSRWLRANVDVSEGGKDNNSIEPTQEATRTKTGYYLKRHLAENEEDTQFGKTNFHSSIVSSWPVVRYADILLMYAEAQTEYLNKAQGASIINDELVYKSIEMVRQRAGLNPYTLKRGMSYDQLIKLIRNERRCEFAFEESRFWDIRRWKIEIGRASCRERV